MIRITHLTVALSIILMGTASANPILLAPSGTTLSTGQVRAEAAFGGEGKNGKYFWLGTGLMQVEANVIRLDGVKGRTENRFGLQWNFLPETYITPAVAFGATDIGSQSAEGIGIYVVVTKRLPVSKFAPQVREFSGTAGIGAAGIRGPFLGFEAKFPFDLFAEAEYDSQDFNAAVGWQPMKLLRLKAYTLRGDTYIGAEVPPITF